MATQDYQSSVQAYYQAIATLYARPVTAMVERGEGDIRPAPDLDERVQVVIDRSQELGESAARGQASADPDQRELAELQLLAAAAIDLHIASDFVRLAEEGVSEEVRERSVSLPGAMVELQAILNADPAGGVRSLLAQELAAQRAAAPSGLEAAKQALREAVEGALIDIRDDAAAIGQAAVVGLGTIPLQQLRDAAGVVLSGLMAQLGERVSRWLRWAASLVMRAIEKILKVLGNAAEEARKKAAEWIQGLKEGALFGTLLDKLYEGERTKTEVNQKVSDYERDRIQAGQTLSAAPFNTAGQRVAELAIKFHKQRQVIGWIITGLTWAQPWIATLQPWGPLAVTAAYVAAIGYIVYAGGDYVDWYRTDDLKGLNFVPGVRLVVNQALA